MSIDNIICLSHEELAIVDLNKYKNVLQLQNIINEKLNVIPEYSYMQSPQSFYQQGVQISNELLQTIADDFENQAPQALLDQLITNLTNPQLIEQLTSHETVMQLILSMQILITNMEGKQISQNVQEQLQSFIPTFESMLNNYKKINELINAYLDQRDQLMFGFLQENMSALNIETQTVESSHAIQNQDIQTQIQIFKSKLKMIQYHHHLRETKKQIQNYYGILAHFITFFAQDVHILQFLSFAQKEPSYCIVAGHVFSQFFRSKYKVICQQVENKQIQMTKQIMDSTFKLFGLMRIFVTKCNELPLECVKEITYFYMETLSLKEFEPVLEQNKEVMDQYVNYIESFQDAQFMNTWERFLQYLESMK